MTRETAIPPTPSDAEHQDDPHRDGAPEDEALFSSDDPIALFRDWLAHAAKSEPNDPNAMSLATVDDDGLPDVRVVLLKSVDAQGFTFYTNLNSAKGRQLASAPKAALGFHWKSVRRQVRVRGLVASVDDAEADAYFATRARDSRIGAWASDQSQPLESKFALQKAVAREAARFGLKEVPRPPFWSGFRVSPLAMEFWRDRPFRLHERRVFRRDSAGAPWTAERLYP